GPTAAWLLPRRYPVAVNPVLQADGDLRGRDRAGVDPLRVEDHEIAAMLGAPIDDTHEVTVAFRCRGAPRHEDRLLRARRIAGPPGAALAGLHVEVHEGIE